MGALRVCNDGVTTIRSDCVGYFNLTLDTCKWQPTNSQVQICIENTISGAREFPRIWQNLHPYNYDSVGWALLTLFEICSGKYFKSERERCIAYMESTVD